MSAPELALFRSQGWVTRVSRSRSGHVSRGARKVIDGRRVHLVLDALGAGRHLAVVESGQGDYLVATLDDATAMRSSWAGVPLSRLRVARVPRARGGPTNV